MGSLTVRAIEGAKPKDKSYKLIDGDGLQLRVATDGAKTWLVRYSVHGKEHQYTLPKLYRQDGGDGYCSLQQARDEAARIRALARQGIDIRVQITEKADADAKAQELARQQEARAQELTRTEGLTVTDMFDAWIANGVRRKDGNSELRRSFHADVLPYVGTIAIKNLTEDDLRAVLSKMVERNVNRTAVLVRNSLTQMFAWAEKRQPWRKLLIDGNPMDLIEIEKIVSLDYDLDNRRDRVLTPEEIAELRDALQRGEDEYTNAADKRRTPQPVEKTTQRGIWIMLSTLCRVGELTMARWEHLDLDAGEWFIPKENVKNSLANLQVYLSPFALDQFRQLRAITGYTDWCFPSADGQTHMGTKSMTKQIGDRQAMFKKAEDGKPAKPLAKRRADNSLVLASGQNGAWTPHDLRRTGATMMQGLGVPLDTIDRCQNHVLSGSKVRRHYMRHDYADEKREAWRLLGARLTDILQLGGQAPNVVPIGRVAA